MNQKVSVKASKSAYGLVCLLWVSVCLPSMGLAAAGDYPVFRKGKWQIDETLLIGGKQLKKSKTKCIDPTDEIKGILTPGNFGPCVAGPPTRSGNQYKMSSKCSGTITGYKNTVITAESDSSYTEDVDERLGKMSDTDTVVAHRVGDCH